MKHSGSNIKKFFIFPQKKAFLIFRAMETRKKFLIFQETGLSYILGKGNPNKFLIFQEIELSNFKLKKIIIF